MLARPVIDARTGLETAELISAPNIVSGNMSVHSSSDLYGWEFNLINRLSKSGETRFELLAGVKSVSLEESLNMVQNSTLSSQATAGFVGGVVVPPEPADPRGHLRYCAGPSGRCRVCSGPRASN